VLRRLLVPAILCLAVLLIGATASAQMPITQADRPGQGTPPEVIPKGTMQVEAGVEFCRQTDGDEPDTGTLTAPDLLLRIALVDRVELRLEAEGFLYQIRDGAGDRALGSDFSLATKAELWQQRGLLPFTGLLVTLGFPVGSAPVTSDGFDPTIAGLYQWSLGEKTALSVNTIFSVPTQGSDDSRRIFQFGPTLTLDRQITERLGAFVEYYGEIKTRGVADEHSLDGGVTWLIPGKRLQLDVSTGGGLNQAAPDWFVSAGFSMRFQAPWAR